MPTPSTLEVSRTGPSSGGFNSNRSTPRMQGLEGLSKEVVLPDIKKKSDAVDRSKPLPTSLQKDFLPEDLLKALTQAPRENLGPPHRHRNTNISNVNARPKPDNVWNHPKRRDAYQHLDPPCLCGAGRDISFLYDVPKPRPASPMNVRDPSAKRVEDTKEKKGLSVPDTILPEEYHLVRNKGVQGLIYVDESQSTLPKDHDKHLVLFPSLKPTSRAEVQQLKRALHDMLERAGLDDDIDKGPTQMHKLLELVKKEQDIYNVVFHEIIRQVSVDCLDRGQLLAELRTRYNNLINKIPRQIKELHEEVVAQRALDRRLTEELMRFKSKIGTLTMELSEVKEHDQDVTVQAKEAQEELRITMTEALKNANLLTEYHQLYELQRQRLEKANTSTNDEKEMWSEAAYSLALKVTQEHSVNSAKRLHTFEQSWAKLANHFTVVLTENDTEMLTELQSNVDTWRTMIGEVTASLRHREDQLRQNLNFIQTQVKKWIEEFNSNVLKRKISMSKLPDIIQLSESIYKNLPRTKEGHFVRPPPDEDIDRLYKSMKHWEQVLNEQLDHFGGDELLAGQEQIFNLNYQITKWTDIAENMLNRHQSDDDAREAMANVNQELQDLHQQMAVRMTGENGSIVGAINMNNALEQWHSRLASSTPLSEAEWLRLYSSLDDWQSNLEDAMQLVGDTQSETDRERKVQHRPIPMVDCMRLSQQWLQSLTNNIDAKDAKLSEDVTTLHTRMVSWMIKALLRRVPDPPDHSDEAKQAVLLASAPEHELAAEAGQIVVDVDRFTSYLSHSCKTLLKAEMDQLAEKNLDTSHLETKLEELEDLEYDASEWRGTAEILLQEMGLEIVMPPEEETVDDEEERPRPTLSMLSLTGQAPLRDAQASEDHASEGADGQSSGKKNAPRPPSPGGKAWSRPHSGKKQKSPATSGTEQQVATADQSAESAAQQAETVDQPAASADQQLMSADQQTPFGQLQEAQPPSTGQAQDALPPSYAEVAAGSEQQRHSLAPATGLGFSTGAGVSSTQSGEQDLSASASALAVGGPRQSAAVSQTSQVVNGSATQAVGGTSAETMGSLGSGPSAQTVGGPSTPAVSRPSIPTVGGPSTQTVGGPVGGPSSQLDQTMPHGQPSTTSGQSLAGPTGEASGPASQTSAMAGQSSAMAGQSSAMAGQIQVMAGQTSAMAGQTSVPLGQSSAPGQTSGQAAGQVSAAPGQTTSSPGQIVQTTGAAAQQTDQGTAAGSSETKKIPPGAITVLLDHAPSKEEGEEVVQILGSDLNTHARTVAELSESLGEFAEITQAGPGSLSQPPDPARSYEALQAMKLLQITLVQTEERAQRAESILDQTQLQLSKAQEEIRKLQRTILDMEEGQTTEPALSAEASKSDVAPSAAPSGAPTGAPSAAPSGAPTGAPSAAPISAPNEATSSAAPALPDPSKQ